MQLYRDTLVGAHASKQTIAAAYLLLTGPSSLIASSLPCIGLKESPPSALQRPRLQVSCGQDLKSWCCTSRLGLYSQPNMFGCCSSGTHRREAKREHQQAASWLPVPRGVHACISRNVAIAHSQRLDLSSGCRLPKGEGRTRSKTQMPRSSALASETQPSPSHLRSRRPCEIMLRASQQQTAIVGRPVSC